MNTATTLGAFAAGLVVVFGGATAVGNAVGPIGSSSTSGHGHGGGGRHGAAGPDAVALPAGLSTSLHGYTLLLERTTLPRARPAELAFRIFGPDGRPVTDYTATHDKELHLIVVRRDGSGFQHLHPHRDAAGRWSTPIALPSAGSYKVFADTDPGRATEAITLAADLSVPGNFQPQPLPAVSRTALVDGYTVTLAGELEVGTASRLVLSVSRAGRLVTDLQPYLAAYGHLVSLREGDLAPATTGSTSTFSTPVSCTPRSSPRQPHVPTAQVALVARTASTRRGHEHHYRPRRSAG
jgi:hypothetical protein